MKIYISGKITGLDVDEARTNFDAAAKSLQTLGFETIDPMAKDSADDDLTWREHMIEDIGLLFDCDAIYMLDNWTLSKGAGIEHAIAEAMDLPIIYQPSRPI